MAMQAGQLGDNGNSIRQTQQNHNAGKNTVLGAIRMASARTGVDFAYLLNKADQESGLNPSAKASTSSATGLYQFVSQTWFKMVKEHGKDYGLDKEAAAISMEDGKAMVDDKAMRDKILKMRHDPVLSAAMAAEYALDNKDYLDAKLGGSKVGSTELYLAHFLGATGAAKFLNAMKTSPNASAAEIMPSAADANHNVFYSKSGEARTLREIYDRFAAKFKKEDTNQFAEADAMDLAAVNGVAYTPKPVTYQRDLAELAPSLFHLPGADFSALSGRLPSLREWQQNGTTSDTLFNTMIMAQSQINDALRQTSKDSKSLI
jgi:hypothetical protein